MGAAESRCDEATRASWRGPEDIRAHCCRASFVGTKVLVFSVTGNDYPLTVASAYRVSMM